MQELRAPFPWFGGKSRAAELVWERFGVVVNLVEPFFGSGAVLLACPEAQRPRVETVNDWNCFLANFWRAVAADGEAVARAADWPVNETDLHSRHRYLLRKGPEIRTLLEDPHAFDVEAAGWWVWGASAWIGSGWCEGIHAAGARGPSRQLPDFIGNGQGNGSQGGHGIHAYGARTRLYDLFAALQERLRYTRVACGDWSRITTPAVTYRHGLTAVFLDPPYPGHGAVYGSTADITPAVRAWALDMGARKDMRICYCGYEGDAPELEAAGWEVVAWKAKGGYGNQRAEGENENAGRERLWFSPACLRPGRDVGQIVIPGC